MAVLSVVGMQWGDEAKGKIVDLLSENVDIVARFQGGPNAGHTVVIGDATFVLHHIPSGILRENRTCIIGNGVIVDLESLVDEIDQLKEKGIDIGPNLMISDRAHLIMPYHKTLDGASEKLRGELKIGTTGRGIGPTYADKAAYKGIRVADLMDDQNFQLKLELNLREKNFMLKHFHDLPELDGEEIREEFFRLREFIRPFVKDTGRVLRAALKDGKNILAEGAQGTMLDVDHGIYPYVTASNPTVGGIGSGLGIPPQKIDQVIGVAKAYTTRVGGGPLPTEQTGAVGESLRERGGEFGSTTGRPRRCGYLDLVVLTYACRVNGVDHLAITKLDVLDSLKKIKVCTGYEFEGEILGEMPLDQRVVEHCIPVYEELDGWECDTSGLEKYDDLPRQAAAYLDFISTRVDVPIALVGTGPGRGQSIILERLV